MKFLEPGHFVRWWDRETKSFVYARLLEREGPLRYPYTFSSLLPGNTASEKVFEDLNPSKIHLYQCYVGIRGTGIRLNVWHPYDEKMLKWDETDLEDIDETEAANLEYYDSPYENPKFQVWIIRDRYPGLVVENLFGNRNIRPQILIIGMKYNYEIIKDATLLDKLQRGLVKCTPISWRKLEGD